MADDKALIEAFAQMAGSYEETVDAELLRFWGWGYNSFVHKVIEDLSLPVGVRVLDVATGTGAIPLALAKQNGREMKIVGLDLTLAMLTEAQGKLATAESVEETSLACATALRFPFAAETFDAVICALALHHMPVEEAMSEMARVLKQGGVVRVADVGAAHWWKIPLIRPLLKMAAFVYFSIHEGLARAWVEASALANIRTAGEWSTLSRRVGLVDVLVEELPRSRSWIPAPMIIHAVKPTGG